MIIRLFAVIMFVQTFLYLCFPALGINGTAFYTYLMGCFIPVSIFVEYKYHFVKNSLQARLYLKNTFKYFLLSILGSIFSLTVLTSLHPLMHLLMNTFLILLYIVMLKLDSKIMDAVKCAILISTVLLISYTIFSYLTETNLYNIVFEQYSQMETISGEFNDYSETRGIKFRVYGNLNNPVFFSGELMLLLGFYAYEYLNAKRIPIKIFYLCLMLLLLLSCFFTGSKSGIIPALGMTFYCIYKSINPIKFFLYSPFLIIICFLVANYMVDVFDIDILTMFKALNVFNENSAGSNVAMRMRQFDGLFQCVGDRVLFGNGLGWCVAYNLKYGSHPVLLGFESIVFSTFCEGGIWGCFVALPTFLIGFLKMKIDKRRFPFYRIFLISFFFFLFVTGMGSIKYFYIIMSIMIVEYTNKLANDKIKSNCDVSPAVSLHPRK